MLTCCLCQTNPNLLKIGPREQPSTKYASKCGKFYFEEFGRFWKCHLQNIGMSFAPLAFVALQSHFILLRLVTDYFADATQLTMGL